MAGVGARAGVGAGVALVTACTPIAPLPRRMPVTTVPIAGGIEADAPDVEYFNANPLMVPVQGVDPAKVRDTFHETRDGGGRLHRATDILAPRGTPVVAAATGTILRRSQSARGGISLYVADNQGRFVFYYAHLDRYSERVFDGGHVLQGEVLGYVGSSGNADPGVPHLHFQAMRRDPARRDYWNGNPVDVRPFFTLTGKERVE